MLYTLAHIVRDRMPIVWSIVERANSFLFSLRYGNRLRELRLTTVPQGYRLVPIREVPTELLVDFFAKQPSEAFTYFSPHGFDSRSLKSLQKNRSFLAYLLIDSAVGTASSVPTLASIAGYCFNRAFFHGKGFRGRMVDIGYRGKGLGTAMNIVLNEVGFGIGLQLYETVSKDNTASYRSAIRASETLVVKEDKDKRELLLEIVDAKSMPRKHRGLGIQCRTSRGGKSLTVAMRPLALSGCDRERRAA